MFLLWEIRTPVPAEISSCYGNISNKLGGGGGQLTELLLCITASPWAALPALSVLLLNCSSAACYTPLELGWVCSVHPPELGFS